MNYWIRFFHSVKDNNGPAQRKGEAEEHAGSTPLWHRVLPGMNVCETVQEAGKHKDKFSPRYSFVGGCFSLLFVLGFASSLAMKITHTNPHHTLSVRTGGMACPHPSSMACIFGNLNLKFWEF